MLAYFVYDLKATPLRILNTKYISLYKKSKFSKLIPRLFLLIQILHKILISFVLVAFYFSATL